MQPNTEPRPGMLAETEAGRWIVIEDVYTRSASPAYRTCVADYIGYECADLGVLLPPRAGLSDAEVLEVCMALPGATWHQQIASALLPAGLIRLELSAGQLRIYRSNWDALIHLNYKPAEEIWIEQEYGDAVCEDWRKVTALRQWLQQAGVQHGE